METVADAVNAGIAVKVVAVVTVVGAVRQIAAPAPAVMVHVVGALAVLASAASSLSAVRATVLPGAVRTGAALVVSVLRVLVSAVVRSAVVRSAVTVGVLVRRRRRKMSTNVLVDALSSQNLSVPNCSDYSNQLTKYSSLYYGVHYFRL